MLKCEVCSAEAYSKAVPTLFADKAGLTEESICTTCFKWSLLHWEKKMEVADALARGYKAGNLARKYHHA